MIADRPANNALLAGFGAYALWGVFPLFWALFGDAGPLETLAHRFVWSFVITFVVLAIIASQRSQRQALSGWAWLRPAVAEGRWVWQLVASILIAVNWGVFILAAVSGHVIEASLGYFINPLVTMLFGRIFFGERLSLPSEIGVALAVVGVCVIAWGSWHTVWISIVLALSFASYGVVKKRTPTAALPGLFLESAFLLVPSLGYLLWLAAKGAGQFGKHEDLTWLFIIAGPVTAVPLWLFAIAARGLRLNTLGIMQYVGPTIQFFIGLLVFHQAVSTGYWAGLITVGVGCAVYTLGLFWRTPTVEAWT